MSSINATLRTLGLAAVLVPLVAPPLEVVLEPLPELLLEPQDATTIDSMASAPTTSNAFARARQFPLWVPTGRDNSASPILVCAARNESVSRLGPAKAISPTGCLSTKRQFEVWEFQRSSAPPLTEMTCPVTQDASSDTR
jgi:hypothetical protein